MFGRKKKVIQLTLLLLTVSVITTGFICNQVVKNNAAGKVYDNIAFIPFNKTGLLLGTSKFGIFNRINPYYRHRIQAATELFKAGKIKYLVISGDNGRNDYSEPEDMRADLINAGVDSTHIFLDYAGFRTYDSMIRLGKIFGQTSVTVISQKFHNERALYIASRVGINAIGYNASDVGGRTGFKVFLREKLARVRVFVDFWLGVKPKFLGDPVNIPN